VRAAWLSAQGRPDLAAKVAHAPTTIGDGAGYDVSSYLLDESPHYIEVKATCGSIAAPFYLSAAERRYALELAAAYSLYRVFDLGPTPSFYKITDVAKSLELTPSRTRRGSGCPCNASPQEASKTVSRCHRRKSGFGRSARRSGSAMTSPVLA
jgi:hypothetical protein